MTSTAFMPQTLDGAQAQPPGYSLLVAAQGPEGDQLPADPHNPPDSTQWESGVQWAPEQIGGGYAVAKFCNGDTDTLDIAENPNTMKAQPFVIGAMDRCSTLGWRARDYVGRATRQLLATQSFSIAREFQLGAIRDAQAMPNVALKDATLIHPGNEDDINALAELEGVLAETFKGRRCMIHVTPQVMSLLRQWNFISLVGQKWTTALGTVIAADAGYTTEDDGFLYAYGTGPVLVRLGRVILNPPSLEDAFAMSDVYQVNKVTIHAEREALVQVDGVIDATPGVGTADAMFKIQLNVHPWGFSS